MDQDYNRAMTKQTLELLQKALALSDEERASLAGSLLDSLDAPVDEDVEAAWTQEIARRLDDLDSGRSNTVPWEEVRARIASRLSSVRQGS
jgi:putative addiction module component (TIGR02574 family)